MEYTPLIITVLTLQVLGIISPGPDCAMVVKNSLVSSRKEGLMTAIGISLGILFHASYSIYLLPHIIQNSALLITSVKYLGAAYLFFIGYQSIRHGIVNPPPNYSIEKGTHRTYSALLNGLLCNVLNPEVILFYISVFTTLLSNSIPLYVKNITAIGMFLIAFTWFSGLSYCFTITKFKHKLSQINHFQRYVTLLAGIIFISFACALLFIKPVP